MNRNEIAAHLAALFCILVWGLTFISTKILLRDFSASEILIYRFFIGWLVLWALTPRKRFAANPCCRLFAAGAGLSGVTLYFLLENLALKFTLAGNVGIIVSTAPFFTGALAWIFLAREKPGAAFFIGFIISLAGIILMSGGRFSANSGGDALALLAAFSWAVYSILLRKMAGYGLDSLTATRGIFFWGLVFMLPFVFFGNMTFRAELIFAPLNLINLLFLGILASALCFAAWTLAVKNLGAVKTSVYIYLVPVVTVMAAAFILDEQLTFLKISGGLLTLLGLFCAEIKSGARHAQTAAKG